MSSQAVLIAGGYGVVGRRIATDLASDYPDRVVITGRNPERANATAAAIGHGVRGRLHAAIERGLRYTDITPHLTELGREAAYEQLHAAARASGSRVLLGAGLVPGISNMIVTALVGTLGAADTIETALLLSAGDVSGPASFDYFLQELAMRFDVHVDGAVRPAQAFSDPRVVAFPAPVGPRRVYLFPFSDQVLYPRTLHARTALTRLALDPPWLARVLALLVRTGAAQLVARERIRRAIASARRDRRAPPAAPFALRLDVTHGERSSHATLVGHMQADATAAGAAALVRALLDGEVAEPGAWMPEQVIDPRGFFSRLARRGLHVEFPHT